MLRLFDTAVGEVVPFEPRTPGEVSMYVCGPTVYGSPHLGHGRFALVFDVLRRYLEWCGNSVLYVSNITDVDDKIIERADREGVSTEEVVARYEREWFEAMDALGVERPSEAPHATEYVGRMVELVGVLMSGGAAYETSDGVYFDSSVVADYGLLARQALDSLRAGARVATHEEKRSPVDFALWKKAKPGEPSWPSPWGEGRPGWHTECVVMSLDLLGEGFDLHGGGQDLAFPHHENERAQAVAAGHRFARHWVHNGFVEVEGEKMSKSLGNFSNLADLLDATDPRAFRLLVLRSHYRSPVEVSRATAADAERALRRLDAFALRASEWPTAPPDAETLDAFRSAMDDDLDTPRALALVFTSVQRANAAADAGDTTSAASLASAVMEITGAVGLDLRTDEPEVPERVAALAVRRDEARSAGDYAAADSLRDEIVAEGYLIEDTPSGTRVRRL